MDATTVGDKAPQSYGWKIKLDEPLLGGRDLVIPTPGLDLRYTDTRYAEVTVSSVGAVWRSGQGKVNVAFDLNDQTPNATITNLSGAPWALGSEVYLYCPHLLGEGNNEWDLKGQIYDLQQRISTLEAGSGGGSDVETRLGAAESAIVDLQIRVQALENASQASITVSKPVTKT